MTNRTWFHLNVPKGLPALICRKGLGKENPKHFWVGNYHRLLKITFWRNNFRAPQDNHFFDSNPDRADALINSYSLQLAKDRNGQLWVKHFLSSPNCNLEEDGGHFKNYSVFLEKADHLSNNSIKQFFVDSQDRILDWNAKGLNLYQETDDSFCNGRQEGCPQNTYWVLQRFIKLLW